MGLLNKMFGGGTGVEVHLDATQVPVGGILSGRATVRGGKKDLQLTALNVRLLYVHTESQDDSPLPKIDIRILIDNTVAGNVALPAGAEQQYPFQITIPAGTEPTAHNVSYQVLVAADIPKVKDPTAKVELKVIEATTEDGDMLSADEIFSRWPALRGTAEQPLVDALHDFRNECYGEREQLLVAEPVLASIVRNNTGEVRRAALDAWSNLLDGHVRREHLALLQELAGQDLDRDTTRELVEAAAKFADEGALPMVSGYAGHPDPEIRRALANSLRFAAEDQFPGKKELLLSMGRDTDAEVRAAVFGAFSDFREDAQVMQLCVQAIDQDPSPEVQAACISTLCFGHHHGMGEMTLQVYERHLQNQHEQVRKEIAENLNWLPKEALPRVHGIVQRLLADGSDEVRRTMAWQFRNLYEWPELAPLLQHSIANDPVEKVRTDGLGALSSVMPMDQAVAYYRQLLAAQPVEPIAWAVMDGVRFKDEPEAKQLLAELAQSQFADVARAAREAMED